MFYAADKSQFTSSKFANSLGNEDLRKSQKRKKNGQKRKLTLLVYKI